MYRLRCRRWIASTPIGLAAVLGFGTLFPTASDYAVNLSAAAVLVVVGAVLLLRPPSVVRLDDRGFVFDRRRASWDELVDVELADTFLGWRLRAGVGRRRPLAISQLLVPAPLADVAAELEARARRPIRFATSLPTRARRRRRPVLITLLVLAAAGLLAGVPLPGTIFKGPAGVVAVGGRLVGTHARPGEIPVLAVEEGPATALDLIRVVFDDAIEIGWHPPLVARRILDDPGGIDRRHLAERSAVAAALACVGRPIPFTGGEVTVTAFRPRVAGTGRLEPGDRLVSVGDRPVRSGEDLYAAARGRAAGDALRLEARARDGSTHVATLQIGVFNGVATPLGVEWSSTAVELGPPAPAVRVDFHGTSGSSSGLAGALALVDALGPTPLAAGRRIAVTGTVSPSGEVGPIGGLRQKAAAAQRAGATVLVVPVDEVRTARRYAGPMSVMGVSTLAEAVRALGGPGCAA